MASLGQDFPAGVSFLPSHFQASSMHPLLSENSRARPRKLRLDLLSDLSGPKPTVQTWLLCVGASLIAAVLGVLGAGPWSRGLLWHPKAQGRKARAEGRGWARVSRGLQKWNM